MAMRVSGFRAASASSGQSVDRVAPGKRSAVAKAPRNAAQLTTGDLAAYKAKERPAVCTTYRIYKVCGMGPPSSGATTVFGILGMLEAFDMKAMGKDNPMSWHLLAEAMQLAYADRAAYLGDSDFVDVPVKGLLDKAYLAERRQLISPFGAAGRYEPGTPPGAKPRAEAPPVTVLPPNVTGQSAATQTCSAGRTQY